MRNNFFKYLIITTLVSSMVLLISSCEKQANKTNTASTRVAPGAPGEKPVWAFSGKTGIGTSYEKYTNKKHGNNETGEVSKVWFSIAQGVLTETMWGLIHEAQIKDMQLIIVGDDFTDKESEDTIASVDYLSKDESGNPNSLAYKITTKDKDRKYEIEKHIFTHPDKQALYVRLIFKSTEKNIAAYIALNPHIANTGINDFAETTEDGFHAWENKSHLSLVSSNTFAQSSVGFVGVSDGLDESYTSTGDQSGNVILLGKLNTNENVTELDIAIGFGESKIQSHNAAQQTLNEGYTNVLAKYNGEGEYTGWQDYLQSLNGLQEIKTASTDGGALLNVSALVLKAQEDKTHSGALIASLSNPWGDTVSAEQSATGYKAVWPRDFYQCAMALLALGDKETPLVAFEYLKKVQVSDSTPGNEGASGWFLQKTHVNGDLEWVAVQLDQTAMPIMLGWKLWQHKVLSNEEASRWYKQMLKPAAEFLVHGGTAGLLWNNASIKPPYTQQERWEEQQGYSPSTTAAVIAGLITAADLAILAEDDEAASLYLQTAKAYSREIESTMFTTQGTFNAENSKGDGKYYLRITQNSNPNDNGKLQDRNGRGQLNEAEILDGGFLELVRYGVRNAQNQYIINSLPEYDDTTLPDEFRVKYEFKFANSDTTFPGWRRYGDDGYGEDATNGNNYGANGKMSPRQRGRVWPFFTGERGHYELALALSQNEEEKAAKMEAIKNTYIKGLEHFANQGLMLPEQVWDGVGADTQHQFKMGEGTNSATPLAWTHAEYVKLVRSLHDQKVWDHYPIVSEKLAPQ